MTAPALTPLLLAGANWVSKLEDFSRGFSGQAAESNVAAIIFAACALCALVWLVDRLYRTRQRHPRTRSVDYLAYSARLLALGRRDLRDLRTVAVRARLSQPAALLLSPGNLAYAIHEAARAHDDPHLRERLNLLCVKLFDAELPPDSNPG